MCIIKCYFYAYINFKNLLYKIYVTLLIKLHLQLFTFNLYNCNYLYYNKNYFLICIYYILCLKVL